MFQRIFVINSRKAHLISEKWVLCSLHSKNFGRTLMTICWVEMVNGRHCPSCSHVPHFLDGIHTIWWGKHLLPLPSQEGKIIFKWPENFPSFSDWFRSSTEPPMKMTFLLQKIIPSNKNMTCEKRDFYTIQQAASPWPMPHVLLDFQSSCVILWHLK